MNPKYFSKGLIVVLVLFLLKCHKETHHVVTWERYNPDVDYLQHFKQPFDMNDLKNVYMDSQ